MTTATAFAPPLSDGQLVAACISGDPAAVEGLFARFQPRLVAHLTRHITIGRAHDAEDLAQESLIKALAALEQFNQTEPLWPWLRRIGENTARDHYRLALHRHEVPGDGLDLDELLPPGGDHAGRQAERDHVARALQALPRKHWEVIVEVDVKQVPQREAAATFGISYMALRKRLDRGRAAFRCSYEAVASLPVFQWVTKLGASKIAAGGALGAGLAVAIPVLIIAGVATAPNAGSQPRDALTPPSSSARVDAASDPLRANPGLTEPPARPEFRTDQPLLPDLSSEAAAETSQEADRPAGAAAGVRTPDVAAPVGDARTSSQFQEGPGYTTYSVPATDLDGSGPLEVSNDDPNVEPVHAAVCDAAGPTALADCRQN